MFSVEPVSNIFWHSDQVDVAPVEQWSYKSLSYELASWKSFGRKGSLQFCSSTEGLCTSDFELPSLLASVYMSALALSCEIHKTGAFHIFNMTRKGDGELRRICSGIPFLPLGYQRIPLVGVPIPTDSCIFDAKAIVVWAARSVVGFLSYDCIIWLRVANCFTEFVRLDRGELFRQTLGLPRVNLNAT